jgi:hypothetical protein
LNRHLRRRLLVLLATAVLELEQIPNARVPLLLLLLMLVLMAIMRGLAIGTRLLSQMRRRTLAVLLLQQLLLLWFLLPKMFLARALLPM